MSADMFRFQKEIYPPLQDPCHHILLWKYNGCSTLLYVPQAPGVSAVDQDNIPILLSDNVQNPPVYKESPVLHGHLLPYTYCQSSKAKRTHPWTRQTQLLQVSMNISGFSSLLPPPFCPQVYSYSICFLCYFAFFSESGAKSVRLLQRSTIHRFFRFLFSVFLIILLHLPLLP